MYRIPPGASDDIAGEQSRDPDDRDSGRQVEVIAIGPSAIVTGDRREWDRDRVAKRFPN